MAIDWKKKKKEKKSRKTKRKYAEVTSWIIKVGEGLIRAWFGMVSKEGRKPRQKQIEKLRPPSAAVCPPTPALSPYTPPSVSLPHSLPAAQLQD